jgi:hypothetical protein
MTRLAPELAAPRPTALPPDGTHALSAARASRREDTRSWGKGQEFAQARPGGDLLIFSLESLGEARGSARIPGNLQAPRPRP